MDWIIWYKCAVFPLCLISSWNTDPWLVLRSCPGLLLEYKSHFSLFLSLFHLSATPSFTFSQIILPQISLFWSCMKYLNKCRSPSLYQIFSMSSNPLSNVKWWYIMISSVFIETLQLGHPTPTLLISSTYICIQNGGVLISPIACLFQWWYQGPHTRLKAEGSGIMVWALEWGISNQHMHESFFTCRKRLEVFDSLVPNMIKHQAFIISDYFRRLMRVVAMKVKIEIILFIKLYHTS